jgi:DNA replicative helicase MCM subunit Mcm2 (Cdc46/Mcm family)
MYKVVVLFLTASLCAFAAMPKLYSPIGDPLYQEIPAVEKMSKIKYFKNDRPQLDSFVREASEHKRLGLLYDQKRKAKNLSKDERQMYRNTLRDLENKLVSISAMARKALSDMIANNQAKEFRQLTQTQLEVFKKDPKSVAEIKTYAKKLRRQQYLRQKREKKQAEDKKDAYEKMLRSAKNLNGTWKGKSSDGSAVTAYFEQEKLTLHYARPEYINIYKGTYTIDKALDFHIYKRELLKS